MRAIHRSFWVLVATICGSLMAAAAMVATTVAANAGEIRRGSVPSPTLGRDYPYMVYLPDAARDGARHLPVVYLLHGAGGDENAWSVEGRIKDTVDKLIAERRLPPVIIVMPGCRGCWWIDGHRDKAETAFWREFEPHIRKTYPVHQGSEGRFVAGLSAGGFGAVRMGIRYPDRFAAVAALSPAIYADRPPGTSSARVQHAFRRPDGSFDIALWKARNYPAHLASYLAQPHRVPFYIASGDGDMYGCAYESVLLFKHLFEHQPDAVELRIVDGTHSWDVWSNSISGALRYMLRFAPKAEEIAFHDGRDAELASGPVAQLP